MQVLDINAAALASLFRFDNQSFQTVMKYMLHYNFLTGTRSLLQRGKGVAVAAKMTLKIILLQNAHNRNLGKLALLL